MTDLEKHLLEALGKAREEIGRLRAAEKPSPHAHRLDDAIRWIEPQASGPHFGGPEFYTLAPLKSGRIVVQTHG